MRLGRIKQKNESISFKKLHQIGKGNIYNFLSNAYQKYASFDPRAIEEWIKGWKDFDDFVFSFTDEDASFGFSTFLGNKAIGLKQGFMDDNWDLFQQSMIKDIPIVGQTINNYNNN